jgi:fibronectin type 3 domain-containing protein
MKYKIRVTITEKTVSDYSYTVEANSGDELAGIIQEILEGSIGGYVADDVEDIESYIDNVELNSVERID